MTEPRTVLRAEPTHRQARHVIAEALPRALQHRHADSYTGLVECAAPQRTGRYADQQRNQPTPGPQCITGQQMTDDRNQRDQGQPAEQAVEHRHRGITAQRGRVFTEQAHKSLQHGCTACDSLRA